ncbi:MAG: SRPBCC family protein [Firmicutes bacterium]|nr:SRPBCC family protein [Bacillota bacterium]
MPVVEVTEVVQAPIEVVYGVISNMEAYPRFMANIETIKVLERGEGYTVTEWHAKLKGARFRWVEKDLFDPAHYRITYDQIEGDLKCFRGYWALSADPQGTLVTLVTEFEFGVPMLASLLNPVARVALRENSRSMLAAIDGELRRDSSRSAP